jgi:pimeloyl-ACP methyl ester carboxylesterase
VPTRCVIGRRDRLFAPDFQRRVIADRLGLTPDEIDTGHLPALSRPDDLAALLLRYAAAAGSPGGVSRHDVEGRTRQDTPGGGS